MTAPLSDQQLAEIRADLDAVPAPPWRWIGMRGSGGPQLVTDHSGRQYLLRAKKPTDGRGDEVLDPQTDFPVYGDLEFRDQRAGERYAGMRPGDQLAVGRTDYDPDSIVGVDNPVARWVERSAAHAAALLAEVERLRLSPHERLILRFALETADDVITSDSTAFTDEDRAAMSKLRALSTGPVVAYRNPWRPGVLLCREHGEGWAGMRPLAAEDLPDGGTCTAGDPANPDDVCGRDVLIDSELGGAA